MEELVFAVDKDLHIIHFSFFVFFALTISLVIFVLLRNPAARRKQFRGGRAVSFTTSALVSSLIAVTIIILAYNYNWRYFYNLKYDDEGIFVEYYLPYRKMRIGDSKMMVSDSKMMVSNSKLIVSDSVSVLRADIKAYTGRYGVRYRLIITDESESRVYVSQLMWKGGAEEALKKTRDAIL